MGFFCDPKGHISNHFMEDLKRLAYYLVVSVFECQKQCGILDFSTAETWALFFVSTFDLLDQYSG
jgi:hypothetical protein